MDDKEKNINKLADDLFVVFSFLRKNLEARACHRGITAPQAGVMHQLVKYGSLSMKELSQKVGLSHSTVSGIVDRLEQKGVVRRFQDPIDRRFTKVAIVDEVRNFMQNKLQYHLFADVMAAVQNATAEEQMKVVEGLRVLRQLVTGLDKPDLSGDDDL